MAWRCVAPTSRSPSLAKPTTDGVVRAPSSLTMTVGLSPSMTETTELVVPRSMPMILPMGRVLLREPRCRGSRGAGSQPGGAREIRFEAEGRRLDSKRSVGSAGCNRGLSGDKHPPRLVATARLRLRRGCDKRVLLSRFQTHLPAWGRQTTEIRSVLGVARSLHHWCMSSRVGPFNLTSVPTQGRRGATRFPGAVGCLRFRVLCKLLKPGGSLPASFFAPSRLTGQKGCLSHRPAAAVLAHPQAQPQPPDPRLTTRRARAGPRLPSRFLTS